MKTKILSTLILLSLFLTSCGEELHLDNVEDIPKIKATVFEKFGENLEVYSLSLSSMNDLSDRFQIARVDYIKDKKSYNRVYVGSPGKPKLHDEKINTNTTFLLKGKQKRSQVKLKDISFEKIPDQAAKAFELIKDEFNNYVLHSYDFDVDSKTNEISAKMQFHCTPNGGSTSFQGRNIVTNYYEVDFDIDAKGNITLRE